ncbi:casein kinase, putative [Trypanosoma cruzi marinkellei]|uniref:non-specific serine/threonine protein kinase n=1 Tax=Trypanosoma cruzi marinkellei TaxID=85056 RepID=K2MS28_TRYCR|nr:casein kinase, putative [Trypanosoma cruzi marinkellei]
MLADVSDSNRRRLPSPHGENDIPLNGTLLEEARNRDTEVRNMSNEKSNPGMWGKANGALKRRKSAAKVAQTGVTVGMRLKRWVITGRLGAGSFGETFTAVEEIKDCGDDDEEDEAVGNLAVSHKLRTSSSPVEVCIKVEKENKNVLRIEAAALKKMQSCPQVARYLGSGNTGGINFLVMERLGPNLAELRRSTPLGTFSHYTTLRLGISCLRAIRGVHQLGLVHRDIKPSNFVIGLGVTSDPRICYLIDFGLARRYCRLNGEVRPPRENAGFRGTSRYASLASHRQQELGRVDDIWSLLFMLIEFATGTLPWRKYKEKEEIGRCKEEVIGPGIVQNLPREFRPFLAHLQTLHYEDEPNYDFLLSLLERAIERRGYPPDKPFDWEHENGTAHSVEFREEKNVSKSPIVQTSTVAANIGVARENSLPRPVPVQYAVRKPLDVLIVPAPEAVNININRPTLAARLMPPSPQSEEEAVEQGLVGVSDVSLSPGNSRRGHLDNGNHTPEGARKLPWNASPVTPNPGGCTFVSENKQGVDMENQQEGNGRDKQMLVENMELIDSAGRFSPREGTSPMINDNQADKGAHVGFLPSEEMAAAQHPTPEFISPQNQREQQQQNSHGKIQKKVTFAKDVDLAGNGGVSSYRDEKKAKKVKRGINCECSAM